MIHSCLTAKDLELSIHEVTSQLFRTHIWIPLLLYLVSQMRLPVSPLARGLNRGLPAPAIAVAGLSQKNYGGGPLTPAIKTSGFHLGSGIRNDLMFPWVYLKVHILLLFSCLICVSV